MDITIICIYIYIANLMEYNVHVSAHFSSEPMLCTTGVKLKNIGKRKILADLMLLLYVWRIQILRFWIHGGGACWLRWV